MLSKYQMFLPILIEKVSARQKFWEWQDMFKNAQTFRKMMSGNFCLAQKITRTQFLELISNLCKNMTRNLGKNLSFWFRKIQVLDNFFLFGQLFWVLIWNLKLFCASEISIGNSLCVFQNKRWQVNSQFFKVGSSELTTVLRDKC